MVLPSCYSPSNNNTPEQAEPVLFVVVAQKQSSIQQEHRKQHQLHHLVGIFAVQQNMQFAFLQTGMKRAHNQRIHRSLARQTR